MNSITFYDLPQEILDLIGDQLSSQDRKKFGRINKLCSTVSSLNPQQLFERLAIDSAFVQHYQSLEVIKCCPDWLRFKIVLFEPTPNEFQWFRLIAMDAEPLGYVEQFTKMIGNTRLASYRHIFQKKIKECKSNDLLVMKVADSQDKNKFEHYILDWESYDVKSKIFYFRYLKLTQKEFNHLNKISEEFHTDGDPWKNQKIRTEIYKLEEFFKNYENNKILSCDHYSKYENIFKRLENKGLFRIFPMYDEVVIIIPCEQLSIELMNRIKRKEKVLKDEKNEENFQFDLDDEYTKEMKKILLEESNKIDAEYNLDQSITDIPLSMSIYTQFRKLENCDANSYKAAKQDFSKYEQSSTSNDIIRVKCDNHLFIFFKEQWMIEKISKRYPSYHLIRVNI